MWAAGLLFNPKEEGFLVADKPAELKLVGKERKNSAGRAILLQQSLMQFEADVVERKPAAVISAFTPTTRL